MGGAKRPKKDPVTQGKERAKRLAALGVGPQEDDEEGQEPKKTTKKAKKSTKDE